MTLKQYLRGEVDAAEWLSTLRTIRTLDEYRKPSTYNAVLRCQTEGKV